MKDSRTHLTHKAEHAVDLRPASLAKSGAASVQRLGPTAHATREHDLKTILIVG